MLIWIIVFQRKRSHAIRYVQFLCLTLLPLCHLAAESDKRCLQCFSATSPQACQQWAMCGPGEVNPQSETKPQLMEKIRQHKNPIQYITDKLAAKQGPKFCVHQYSTVGSIPSSCSGVTECFTREFIDHQGRQSYRLGCETIIRCNSFMYAQYLVGKRDVQDDEEDRAMCYKCCGDQDDCNSRLCVETVGHHVTPSTPVPIHTCPPTFSAFNGHCYFVAAWLITWPNARIDCQRRGADLVSINDKAEQDFLVHFIDRMNSTQYPTAIWTGSFWVPATTQWNWLDNTAINYTAWGPSQPAAPDASHHIAMVKDSAKLTTGGWLWSVLAYSESYGFICEREML